MNQMINNKKHMETTSAIKYAKVEEIKNTLNETEISCYFSSSFLFVRK